tara:strand:+ start:19423 stop:19584 length:162 start_codon:yes stop_codon:yes gene_type:complete
MVASELSGFIKNILCLNLSSFLKKVHVNCSYFNVDLKFNKHKYEELLVNKKEK